jgi:hypothetical protein
VGQIRWAYYVAARLEGYAVSRDDAGIWRLSGRVVISDAFKLSQRPLMFIAPHAKGEWRWPILELTVDCGQVRARLGALESSDAKRKPVSV